MIARDEYDRQLAEARPLTRQLIEAVRLDAWPGNAAIVDFGLRSQEHYEALYHPIREGEISPRALDEALGDGRKLTELARASPSNPHKDVEFSTSWDAMLGEPPPAISEEEKLSAILGELLGDAPAGEWLRALATEHQGDSAQRVLRDAAVDYGGEHGEDPLDAVRRGRGRSPEPSREREPEIGD